MSEYTILPLINASFQPGEAKRTVAGLKTGIFRKLHVLNIIILPGRRRNAAI